MVNTLYPAGEHPSRLSTSKETKKKYSALSTCCFLHPSSALSRPPTMGGVHPPLRKQLCSGSMVPTCPALNKQQCPMLCGGFCFLFFFFFCCIESLLLHTGFLGLRPVGVIPLGGARGSRCGGFSCCRVPALAV